MSAEKKKELQVAALENGTAIDHIPPSQLFKVASLLGLEKMNNTITIGSLLVIHFGLLHLTKPISSSGKVTVFFSTTS